MINYGSDFISYLSQGIARAGERAGVLYNSSGAFGAPVRNDCGKRAAASGGGGIGGRRSARVLGRSNIWRGGGFESVGRSHTKFPLTPALSPRRGSSAA